MKELIARHNPWWRGEEDHHLSRWREMRIRWVPEWIRTVGLKPFSLNFVIGARQVGKTTGLKLLIGELLKKVDPERIFYFNCDFSPDAHSLGRVLEEYLEFRSSAGHRSSFIFLDEVTSTKGWWRAVKGYIDLGMLKDDVLTVTGSSSLRLKGDVELFPGRRGMGRDIVVHPLSFREFLEVHGIRINVSGNVEEDMKRVAPRINEIKRLFVEYLRTGGFPLSVNGDPRAEEDFIKAFEGEMLRLNRNLPLAREILSSIMKKAPSPLSYTTIASDTSGYSYKTVADYLDVLKGLFILGTAAYRERGRTVFRKEKKVYFTDPFVAKALSLWSGQEFMESALYEWVVQSHLFRRFGEVYYYRNSYEVDCLAGDLQIEVKAGKPHRKYPPRVMVLDSEDLPSFLAVM